MDTSIPALVSSYLRSLRQHGKSNLPIDNEATIILRNWYRQSTNNQKGIRTHTSVTTEVQSKRPSEPTQGRTFLSPVQNLQAGNTQENLTIPTLLGTTIEEKLSELQVIAENWVPAVRLSSLRNRMVFSTGNPHAQLMLIGEAPGYHEEKQREPFVGPAGEKLTAILKAMGLQRSDVYISNIVKFRPAIENQTTNNRQPTLEEVNASLPIIKKEIELIAPKVIVALGATAANGLLRLAQEERLPLASLRGQFHDFQGIPVRVTYHPSYLLRNGQLSEKRKLWEDMLAVMTHLNLPISEKQRRYFL